MDNWKYWFRDSIVSARLTYLASCLKDFPLYPVYRDLKSFININKLSSKVSNDIEELHDIWHLRQRKTP